MQPEQSSDTENPDGPASPQNVPPVTPLRVHQSPHNKRRLLLIALIILLIIVGGFAVYLIHKAHTKPATTVHSTNVVSPAKATTKTPPATAVQGVQLDAAKKYGDKYKDGILPVGDGQYSASAAEKGKVYLCHANFVPTSQAGAQVRGPWFSGTTKWNINKKSHIQGSVQWEQRISNTVTGSTRVISTNDLPDHITGIFPVASTDPAAQYDRNPNTITSQSFTYTLTASPAYGTPQCMGGEVGVMLTGAALFNAFDAGGRDAGAWEVQDTCDGHPQGDGEYHYHTLSNCIKDVGVGTVIGFALDGFPITGPKVGTGNYLTTDDLDECHGLTSQVTLDGKKVTSYHYVMTEDFPYSASCFRAAATQPPEPHTTGQADSRGARPPQKQP